MPTYPKYGDKGPAVKQLQQALIAAGFPLPTYGADGGYGRETERALTAFQKAKGLTLKGGLDAATWNALFPAEVSPTKPPVKSNEQPSNAGLKKHSSTTMLAKYGKPADAKTQGKYMIVWKVPEDIQKAFAHVLFSATGTRGFPKTIFINKDFQRAVEKALRLVIERGHAAEMKTWDGCYQPRNKVSGKSWSMHAWGGAIDVNAGENGYNKPVKLSGGFLKCFTDCGIITGALWGIKDGMHQEMAV